MTKKKISASYKKMIKYQLIKIMNLKNSEKIIFINYIKIT